MHISRRQILTAASVLGLGGCGSTESFAPAQAQTPPAPPPTTSRLFVLSSQSGSLVGDRLVLQGVSPATVFFADRPGRTAGRLSTADFIHSWAAQGFAQDPPNAALQLGGTSHVYELTNPVYTGDTLAFRVVPAQGQNGGPAPASFGAAALFIDDAGDASKQASLSLSFSIGFLGVANVILGSDSGLAEFAVGLQGLAVELPLNGARVQSVRLSARELTVQALGPTEQLEPITLVVTVVAPAGTDSIFLNSPEVPLQVTTFAGIINVPAGIPTRIPV